VRWRRKFQYGAWHTASPQCVYKYSTEDLKNREETELHCSDTNQYGHLGCFLSVFLLWHLKKKRKTNVLVSIYICTALFPACPLVPIVAFFLITALLLRMF
jgi:hypothetical protein